MPGKTRCLLVLSLVVLATALGSQSAAATTFCVPTVAACSGGAGVAKADLEEAMGSNSEDGQADTVYVGAGTFTEDADYEPEPGTSSPDTFEPDGTDPLTVIGAGAGATTLTSAGTTNIYVVNLSWETHRHIALRGLSIEVPSSFSDGPGYGSAIVLFDDDSIEDFAIVSFNDESSAIRSAGNASIRNGVIRGGGLEGSIRDGISAELGETTVEDTEIEGASWGLITGSSAGAHLTARRVRESGTRVYGAIASGGIIRVENSIFQTDDGIALIASASSQDSAVVADHLTAVNTDGATHPAMELLRFGSGPGDMSIEASNSILRGFGSGYKVSTVLGPGIGTATLTARYSNFQHTGTSNGSLDLATGNIDTDPLLLSDYSLPSNSPSVDAGDPAAGGLATDFLGAVRPNDGDGDGVAVRDQGAFEYQRPLPPAEEGGGGGGGGGSAGGGGGSGSDGGGGSGKGSKDTAPPQTTIAKGPGAKLALDKAKFSFRSSEKGSTFVCKLDKRKAKPCASPKTYKGLKLGPHTFKVWASDAAGNKDATPAKRNFKVPA